MSVFVISGLFNFSLIISIIAVTKNPIITKFPPNILSNKNSNINTIIIVGIVAVNNNLFVLQKGFLYKFFVQMCHKRRKGAAPQKLIRAKNAAFSAKQRKYRIF